MTRKKHKRLDFNLLAAQWLCGMGGKNSSINKTQSTILSSSASSLNLDYETNDQTTFIIKSKRQKIKDITKEPQNYSHGFHIKYTTAIPQKCSNCYKNKICTKTRDYCIICKVSLCNKLRCWDKMHFMVKPDSEDDDSYSN